MKFSESYSFLTILVESVKLLPKNGKLIAFIALFSVVLSSFISFLFNYSIQSLVSDMVVNIPDPNSFDPASSTPQTGFATSQFMLHLREDMAVIYAIEIALFLAFSTIFFFSTISTVLASASAKNLSLKELLSILYKTWTRPLITSFYVSSLSIGYFSIVLILASPLLIWPNLTISFWVAIFVGIPASIFYLYLIVPWTLSIVVSVVEESSYGVQALGKGAQLVKGKRLLGFLLNMFFYLVHLIIFQGSKMLLRKRAFATRPTISLMLLTSVVSLVNIFVAIAYTVFYEQCKEQNGEEIKLQGSVQYTKVPTTNDIP